MLKAGFFGENNRTPPVEVCALILICLDKKNLSMLRLVSTSFDFLVNHFYQAELITQRLFSLAKDDNVAEFKKIFNDLSQVTLRKRNMSLLVCAQRNRSVKILAYIYEFAKSCPKAKKRLVSWAISCFQFDACLAFFSAKDFDFNQICDSGLLNQALLLQIDPKPNNVQITATKLLHIAAASGNHKIVAWLINSDKTILNEPAGFKYNAASDYHFILYGIHVAALSGDIETIKLFINAKIDINLRASCNEFIFTPIILAIKYGHLNIVQALLEKAHWNSNLLLTAIENNQVEIVEFLLKHDSTKTLIKPELKDLFIKAFEKGNAQIAKLLLTRFPDHWFYFAIKNNNLKMIQYLLTLGVDVSKPFRGQYQENQIVLFAPTPIFLACMLKNVELIKLLLAAGADLEMKTQVKINGQWGTEFITPLSLANFISLPKKVVDLLVEKSIAPEFDIKLKL